MLLTGLDWKYFNWHQMEFFGKLNLLKSGIGFLTRSARSVLASAGNSNARVRPGLEGVLQHRRDALYGILNGIDDSVWKNPVTDPNLAAKYTPDSVASGKPVCKAALQRELGLEEQSDAPLVGMIGRRRGSKGLRSGGRRAR